MLFALASLAALREFITLTPTRRGDHLVGRHKIAPELSPSKTVEGFVGGVASATVLGALLWWITPFSPWQAGLMALMINLIGFCGGLVMSAIKRDRGVKDSSV